MNINRILTNCRGVPAVAQNTPARQIHQDHMALSGLPTAPREFFAGDEVDVKNCKDAVTERATSQGILIPNHA